MVCVYFHTEIHTNIICMYVGIGDTFSFSAIIQHDNLIRCQGNSPHIHTIYMKWKLNLDLPYFEMDIICYRENISKLSYAFVFKYAVYYIRVLWHTKTQKALYKNVIHFSKNVWCSPLKRKQKNKNHPFHV